MRHKPSQLSEGTRQHKELNRCCSSPQQCWDHTFLLLCTSQNQLKAQCSTTGAVQVLKQVCKDAGLVFKNYRVCLS